MACLYADEQFPRQVVELLLNQEHCGIVACVDDSNRQRMAQNIDQALHKLDDLTGQLIRVYRIEPSNLKE